MFSLGRFFLRNNTSGSVAKERLRLLLVSDRADCSPETLELMKKDIINVISKYIDIDKDMATIEFENKKIPHIFANIPIKEVRF